MDALNLREMWAKAAAIQKRYLEEGEEAQLSKWRDAYHGLRSLGWSDATYAPKDGTRFLAICGNGSEPRPCSHLGEGGFFLEDAGDLWPVNPVLWKPMPKETTL